MSNISTIIDAVRTKVTALFPDKHEIPNPYLLESNAENFLQDGFGIRVDASSLTAGQTFYSITEDRTITIIISEKAYRIESNPDPMYIIAKNILEDALSLKVEFMDKDQLAVGDAIESINYNSDTGINFVFRGKHNFAYTEISFDIRLGEATPC